MTTRVIGAHKVSLTRDDEGHREYKVTFRVESNTGLDGPAVAILTPGLPAYGATWNFGDEVDIWAWCRWGASVSPVTAPDRTTQWDVEYKFSTKPPDNKSCQSTQIEDPLLQPQKISGGFKHYQEEAIYDRFGNAITNSAWEPIRGPQNEWDKNRDHVKIEQNVPDLQYALVSSMRDTVNQYPLWGLPKRTIKLSSFSWERKFYGSCSVYYTRTFEFDIRYETFDRDILDEGTKVLSGHWDTVKGSKTIGNWILDNIGGASGPKPDKNNPAHFIRYKDRNGENSRVILNGYGLPAGVIIGIPSALGVNVNTGYFISIQGGNTNHPLSDSAWWVPVAFPPLAVPWNADDVYPIGSVVTFQPAATIIYYVAVNDNQGSEPDQGGDWISLGPSPVIPTGVYSDTATYGLGSAVQDSGANKTSSGTNHVEKYSESDFILLAIPTSF